MWFRTKKTRRQVERKLKIESLENRRAMAGDLLSSLAVGTTVGGESFVKVVAQDGNRYVALDLMLSNGPIDIDPQHTYVDNRDIFTPAPTTLNSSNATLIAKYDSQGMLQWRTQVNGIVKSMEVDGLSNVYVTGFVIGSNVMMGTVGLTTNANNADIFLAKLRDSDGGWAFVKQITNTAQLNEVNSDLVVTPDGGTVYVSSNWSSSGYNSSIAKITVSSDVPNTAWTDLWTGSNVTIVDLKLLSTNQLVIAGTHRGQSDFDPGAGTLNLLSGPNKNSLNSAGFSMLVNTTGTLVWAKNFKASSTGGSTVTSIVVDASGIALSGNFSGSVDFDPNAPTVNLVNRGGTDLFFAKLSANGSFLGASSYGSSLQESAAILVANPAGGYVLTSRTVDSNSPTNYSQIRKLDTAGNVVWTSKAESALIQGVAVDSASQEIIVVGSFSSDLYYTDPNGVRSLRLHPNSTSGLPTAFWFRIAV